MIYAPLTLRGRWARLEPLAEKHLADLYAASRDPEIWEYLPTPFPRDMEEMRVWLNDARATQTRGEMLPFAIVEGASGKAIGSTRYLDLAPQHRRIEIGWTWLGRAYWRTPINTECKYLLLKHAFEDLNCIRVQLKTDLRNERSQRAIERIGGVREGVLRKAVIVKDDYQRWSVYYSILDDEWDIVKARLESMLARTLA
jgi:RimJ/RimL family protein N-acetyltransferase